jgi:hypothetical protein
MPEQSNPYRTPDQLLAPKRWSAAFWVRLLLIGLAVATAGRAANMHANFAANVGEPEIFYARLRIVYAFSAGLAIIGIATCASAVLNRQN